MQIMEDITWKRHFLYYMSVPKLERIAAVNVVILLWKEHIREAVWKQDLWKRVCVCRPTSCFPYEYCESRLAHISDKVEEALFNLTALPVQLKAKAAYFIRPIGLQILKWMHRSVVKFSCFTHANSVNYIYWTMKGTIDVAKTLEMYFGDIKDLQCSYYIACWYCLEGCISRIWMQMPEIVEKCFSSKSCKDWGCNIFVTYWTCYIKKELHRFLYLVSQKGYDIPNHCCSIYEIMFTSSLHQSNVAAVKYFWNKLTNEEISRNIVEWIGIALKYINYIQFMVTDERFDILWFLLLKVNEILLKQVFLRHSVEILKTLFFGWPWQSLLFPIIELMWDILDNPSYVYFLTRVLRQIKVSRSVECYFKELWSISPIKFKECFIQFMSNNKASTNALVNLCQAKDHEIFPQILTYASIEEKKKIVLSAIASDKLFELFYSDKLSLFKALMEEVLSDSEIANFKNKLVMQCGGKLCQFWICDNNWQCVEKFLQWCFISDYEICCFKKEKIDQFAVFCSLTCVGNYELVDRFMNWRFSSADEIKQFKKGYLRCNSLNYHCLKKIIVKLSYCDEGWNLFEKFMKYCFSFNDEVNQFKKLLTYPIMGAIVSDVISYGYNFDFSSKLLSWRYSSEKEIDVFKRKLSSSDMGKDIAKTLACDIEVLRRGYEQELVNMLNEWFSTC